MGAIKIPRYDDKCALCRVHDANKTGSHLAPNFMIHSAFSFDGKGKRFREIAIRHNLNGFSQKIYYGSEVSPEAITADLGHEITDEELEENTNSLECDYLFCSRCEDRFGMLETEYAQFYNNGKNVDSKIAYLFWLSVFWRMCVGRMSIFMKGEDEFEIREILDKFITTKEDIMACAEDMGDWGYVLWRTKGIQKGDSGIFGTRTEHAPYMIILNDMVVLLIREVSKLNANISYAGWQIELDGINTYKEEEIIVNEISLQEFALFKRFVIDEAFNVGWGPSSEKVKLDIREKDRSEGKLHSVDEEDELIEEAGLSDEEVGIQCNIRNLYKFHLAELKRFWFMKKRKPYNILKDRSMFVFPFDIENYKRDLLKYHRLNGDISNMPLVDVYMDKSYWKGKKGYREKIIFFNSMIEELREKGYTDNDINDNLRTKEII